MVIRSRRQKAIRHMASIAAQSLPIHCFLRLKPSIFGEAIKVDFKTIEAL